MSSLREQKTGKGSFRGHYSKHMHSFNKCLLRISNVPDTVPRMREPDSLWPCEVHGLLWTINIR